MLTRNFALIAHLPSLWVYFFIAPSAALQVIIYLIFIKLIEQKSYLLVSICTSLITRTVSVCWMNMKCENEYECGSAFFIVTIRHSESRVQPGIGCSFYSPEMAYINLSKRKGRIVYSVLLAPSCHKNCWNYSLSYLYWRTEETYLQCLKGKRKVAFDDISKWLFSP